MSTSQLLKSYLDIYLKYNPGFGSQYGFCEYDDKLEDPSAVNLIKEIDDYIEWIKANNKYKDVQEYKIIVSKIKKRIYDIIIWERPFIDPNYYFNIIYNSLFWVIERNNKKELGDHKRLALIPNLLETMMDNLRKVPRKYIDIWKKNITSINNFRIQEKYKNALIKIMNNYTKYIEALPDTEYFIGHDKLQKFFNNNEMKQIDLKKIYETALGEHKKYKKMFLKELNKIEGKTLEEKVNNYENKYFLTNDDYVSFVKKLYSELKSFLKENKILDVSFLKSKLNIVISDLLNMNINEIHPCKSKNNFINLYIFPLDPPYKFNYISEINVLVHEYIHYIQYECDRDRNDKYSVYLNNISTGEGVAFFFEEYIYNKGFYDHKYKLSFLHNLIYVTGKFILGYEIHAKKLSYEKSIERCKELSIYYHKETLIRIVNELISDTYTMEYYLGKAIIKMHIKKNKNFNVNTLIKYGSIPLTLILDK